MSLWATNVSSQKERDTTHTIPATTSTMQTGSRTFQLHTMAILFYEQTIAFHSGMITRQTQVQTPPWLSDSKSKGLSNNQLYKHTFSIKARRGPPHKVESYYGVLQHHCTWTGANWGKTVKDNLFKNRFCRNLQNVRMQLLTWFSLHTKKSVSHCRVPTAMMFLHQFFINPDEKFKLQQTSEISWGGANNLCPVVISFDL